MRSHRRQNFSYKMGNGFLCLLALVTCASAARLNGFPINSEGHRPRSWRSPDGKIGRSERLVSPLVNGMEQTNFRDDIEKSKSNKPKAPYWTAPEMMERQIIAEPLNKQVSGRFYH